MMSTLILSIGVDVVDVRAQDGLLRSAFTSLTPILLYVQHGYLLGNLSYSLLGENPMQGRLREWRAAGL